jgi:hypothetical protein
VTKGDDARARQRATAAVRADHEPQRLKGFAEPRLSRADERVIVGAANNRNETALRSDVAAALATIAAELEYVKARLGRVAPGDHRGYLREIDHGLKGLTHAVTNR